VEISGRSTETVDTVVWEDDYFMPEAIGRFVARLEATEAAEQFLFRESEFDCAFRQIDMRIADLKAAGATNGPEIGVARKLWEEVWEGHEQVGARNAARAAMAWRRMAMLVSEQDGSA
jgi:hypothetical protein